VFAGCSHQEIQKSLRANRVLQVFPSPGWHAMKHQKIRPAAPGIDGEFT